MAPGEEAHDLLRQQIVELHTLTSLLVEKGLFTEAEYRARFDWFKQKFGQLSEFARSLAYRENAPTAPPPEMAKLMTDIQNRLFART